MLILLDVAFVAGVITSLWPCVLPLLPLILARTSVAVSGLPRLYTLARFRSLKRGLELRFSLESRGTRSPSASRRTPAFWLHSSRVRTSP